VTERPGRLRIVAADGTLSAPLAGVPAVHAQGQGGLLAWPWIPTSPPTAGLSVLCRAGPGRRLHRRGPRPPGRHRVARRAGHLPSTAQAPRRPSLRLASGVRARRHAFRHPGRAQPVRARPGPRQPPGHHRAHPRRRLGAPRQSLRGPGRRPAGNLVLRPPQRPGRHHPSGHRRPVGGGTRSPRRRRGEHRRSRPQLRLAAGELGPPLHRPRHPRPADAARPGRTGVPLDARDRCLRHGLLHRRALQGLARRPAGRRPGGPRRGAPAGGRSARERTGTHQCRRACARRGAGPRRAIYVLTDESHGKVLRLTPKAGPAR